MTRTAADILVCQPEAGGFISPHEVARTWRLYGLHVSRELRNAAREMGVSEEQAKLLIAARGLCVADCAAEEVRAKCGLPGSAFREALISRAITEARRILAWEYGSERDRRPLTARPESPVRWERVIGDEDALACLRGVATTTNEFRLLDGLGGHGCRTLREVERLWGWKPGYANTVLRRLAGKWLKRQSARGIVSADGYRGRAA